MMLEEIAALVATGESETLEFKETTGMRRQAVQTVCAFLNRRGGQVLFGVMPDGDVVGQHVGKDTIDDLSAEIQKIDPPTFPTIERIPVGGERAVVVVHTDKGELKPYTYRSIAYQRVGSTTLTMSADEYNRMLLERIHDERRWENHYAAGWSIDDLDTAEIKHTVAEAVRRGRLEEPMSSEPSDMLRGLGLLHDGELLRAAVVLFGNAERIESEMPQCLLRVARFRGVGKMEFLDNRQFYGNAFTLLTNADRFLRETLPIAGRFEQDRFERIDQLPYPVLAIREALANALCHRDYAIGGGSVGIAVYDDRLEVTSSGPLHFGLTPEKLFTHHESKPWNPLIARTFYRRGIVEEWGSGTLKMLELASKSGLPPPEIDDDGGCVTVRFRYSQHVLKRRTLEDSTKLKQDIVRIIHASKNGLTRREIHSRLDAHVSERQVRRALEHLKHMGVVVVVGRGWLARWRDAGRRV